MQDYVNYDKINCIVTISSKNSINKTLNGGKNMKKPEELRQAAISRREEIISRRVDADMEIMGKVVESNGNEFLKENRIKINYPITTSADLPLEFNKETKATLLKEIEMRERKRLNDEGWDISQTADGTSYLVEFVATN